MPKRRNRSKQRRARTKQGQDHPISVITPAQASQDHSTGLRTTLWIAFLLSGLAGLMHQVVWAKLLVQLIGATAHAQATVLAVFMGGLALGAVFFGRWVDRSGRALRTYVWLELAIAGYCLILPLLLFVASDGYAALASQFFESTGLKLGLRVILAVLVVLPPAILMGGTLPALARHLIGDVQQTRRRVAQLYALNSFGAVLGAGIAGFVVLPIFGVYGSLILACLTNVIAGLVLLPAARREPVTAELPKPPLARTEDAYVYRADQRVIAVIALALSGFSAMAYEVLFSRIIALAFGSTTHSFSAMLMSFIAGIAIGSSIASRIRIRHPLWLLGVAQLMIVIGLAAATPLIERMPYLISLARVALQDTGAGYELFQLIKALLCLSILLIPTICLGLAFPLVAHIQTTDARLVGGSVGSTYAWNTIGNVLGATLTSLVILPAIGLLNAFHLSLAVNLTAGFVLIAACERQIKLLYRTAAVVVTGCICGVYLLLGNGWVNAINLAHDHLYIWSGPNSDEADRAVHPLASFDTWKRTYTLSPSSERIQFFAEDAHATVLVKGNEQQRTLYINGKPDASTNREDMETQLLFAHIPLFMSLQVRSVMMLGYGSGITLGATLTHPVEHVDLVEISGAVLKADVAFRNANREALSDPRVKVFEEDGLSFLRTTPRQYDLVVSEPSNPWMKGISDVFTVDFFETVRDSLRPNGVFTFWFHTYLQEAETIQLVLRTLASVFPHAMIFSDNDSGNLIVLGSMKKLKADFANMEARFQTAEVQADLRQIGTPSLLALLTHHRFSEKRFSTLTGSGPLNTAMHQRLEYAAIRAFFAGAQSYFIEKQDPLVRSFRPPVDILLDHYLDWRKRDKRPVMPEELMTAARYVLSLGGYGKNVATALQGRARLIARENE